MLPLPPTRRGREHLCSDRTTTTKEEDMAVVGTLEILSTTLTIHASSSGSWSLSLDEGEDTQYVGRGDTLEQAKAQARTFLQKQRVKVSVPFVDLDNGRGVAHSIHARNRTILVEFNNGKKDALNAYAKMLKADTPVEVRERLI